MTTTLTPELVRWKQRIEAMAREAGLDFHPVVFEMVDYDQMNHVAAYGGFPTRYPHWRFGMEYDRLSKSYRYGLSKIYELVVNTNPVYAYLLNSNAVMDQKLVMAHVYGHADFFKNNTWFQHTDRKMMDETANHASRVRRIMLLYGQERVESFIDACLSLEDLIDPHSPFIRRRPKPNPDRDEDEKPTVRRLKSKDYMESFINPKRYLEEQERKLAEAAAQAKRFPANPERDVLLFLIEHAPLERWQRDILSIVREEAYYFAPQGQTKIMNEGWASYWHSKLMTEQILSDEEIIDYADHHSGTVSSQPGRLNPYKLGIELFRDIEDRWNRGRFGKDYDECDDYTRKQNWDTGLNQGREKIFEVRRVHNDVTFVDTFLTQEFCREQKLFVYAKNGKTGQPEVTSRDFQAVKTQLLNALTNHGRPFIYVTDANFGNRGELCLTHRYEGTEIQKDYAAATLRNLALIWGRPVHLESEFSGARWRLSSNGEAYSEEEIPNDSAAR